MVAGWIGRCGLLVALVTVVYGAGLSGGFIFDDYPNLLADPSWQLQVIDLEGLRKALWGGISSDTGRPLAMLSFALNHFFFGPDPWWLKAVSVAWHVLNAILLYQVLVLCLQVANEGARIGVHWVAVLAAAAWAVHPLQASTVLYVVQRMEIGAATGVLLALLCYLKGRLAIQGGQSWMSWAVGLVLAMVLGLGFKETIVLVPLYTLLLELFLLRFRGPDGDYWPLLGRLYAAGLVVALVLYFAYTVPAYGLVARYPGREFGTAERLLSQGAVLSMYLVQAVSGWPEFLRFYYDDLVAWCLQVSWWQILIPLLGLVGLAGSAILMRRRMPLYALGIGWFLAGHVLTSNIWPLELAFEHRNYFPLAGLVLAATAVALTIGRRLTVGAGPALSSVLLGYLCLMGGLQAATWGDEGRLALTLANRAPASERAGYALGQWLYRQSGGDAADPSWSLAWAEMVHAAQLPLSSALPEHAMVIMAARAGRPVEPDLWDSFQDKVSRREVDTQTLLALEGVVQCANSGQCRFDDEGRLQALLLAALASTPLSDRLHARYGEFVLARMGDRHLAVAMFREAIALAPQELGYRVALARLLLDAGEVEDRQEAERLVAWLEAHDQYGEYAEDVVRWKQALQSGG